MAFFMHIISNLWVLALMNDLVGHRLPDRMWLEDGAILA